MNKQVATNPITVITANNNAMKSTHTAELDLPTLPKAARTGHIIPDLGNMTLVTIGQMCDAGCTVQFDKSTVTIRYQGEDVLHGVRSPATNNLWYLTPPKTALLAVNQSAKPADLVRFAHAALFSPSITTLEQALRKRYIINFPGLTVETLRKYPPLSEATVKGHLDQVRKNKQSTKRNATPPPPDKSDPTNVESLEDAYPPGLPDGHRTHYCYVAIAETEGEVFTDGTGRFIVPSRSGNTQLLILYDYDSNSIHPEPMKNKEKESILEAYKNIHQVLVKAGLRPKLQKLDNEASEILKQFMHEEEVKFQLVPPGMHRRNAAERAIRTFQNHFIAGLCTTHKDFPLSAWDKLIPQAKITLNLLRGSRMNPKLSAYEQVFGAFDFNRTPITPPGIKVLVHIKPDKRAKWTPHAIRGFYVGSALEHNRNYRTYIPKTRKERTSDTVVWFPEEIPMPGASTEDIIAASLDDIAQALKNPQTNSPLYSLSPTQTRVLKELTTLFPVKPNKKTYQTPRVETGKKDEVPRVAEAPEETSNEDTGSEPENPQRIPRVRFQESEAQQPDDDEGWTKVLPRFKRRTPPERRSERVRKETNRMDPDPNAKTYDNPQKGVYVANSAILQEVLQEIPEPECNHLPKGYALKAINPDTGQLAEYRELLKSTDGQSWEGSFSDEIGRLYQGNSRVPGTDTLFFIRKKDIPKGRTATYVRIVAADRPMKENTRRTRLTAGGDKLDYPYDVSTKTSSMVTTKLVLNHTVSTDKAKFMGIDIKDFYLNNDMEYYEYVRIPAHQIPRDIWEQYKLDGFVEDDGYVYSEARKGIYGLKQAGRIAHDALVPHLAKHGYHPTKYTHGLFKHETRPVIFVLTVDDFGVSYVEKEHAEHLERALCEKYTCSTNWEGDLYCGLTLKWDYENRYVDASMPGYVEKALARFEHPLPRKPQDSPYPYTRPDYGAKVQLTPPEDTTPTLEQEEKKRLQEVVGTLLYYARAVDNTMLVALGSLAAAQTKGTKQTMDAMVHLLNYAATHPDAVIRFKKSDMILHIHSDASYLSEPEGKSRVGGFFFLDGPDEPDPNKPPSTNKWSNPRRMRHTKERNVIRSGVRSRRTIPKRPGGVPNQSHTRRNGTQTTRHTHHHQ